jgi:hypothetical protein
VVIGTKGLVLLAAAALQTPGVHQGLEITVKSVERARNVSLQDCPPGENIVRGVIRPVEENEFATISIEVKVLPSFAPGPIPKPLLYDEADKAYKTAQSFEGLAVSSTYTCAFSFRVPTGTKLSRFAIGEASYDVAALEAAKK